MYKTFEKLGYTEEESKIQGTRNIYFEEFSLPWLKLLTKLTVLASAREKVSLSTIGKRLNYLKQFDNFLVLEGYNQPELRTDSLLQKLALHNK